MENTQNEVPAWLVRSVAGLNIFVMFVVLLVPFINFFIGLKVLAGFVATAGIQRRILKLLAAILASVPIGFVVTWKLFSAYIGMDAGRTFETAWLLYLFVTGPAFAGLAGVAVVYWPARRG
jgi:hypothetical protein